MKFVSGSVDVLIQEQSINHNSLDTGAVASFTGVVRADRHASKNVTAIEFSAQKEISIKQFNLISEKAIGMYGIFNVVCFHSLGLVESGKPCFYVQVKAGHRKEAFSALPYIVDEIKKDCPIFGKEIFDDGSYKWKENKI